MSNLNIETGQLRPGMVLLEDVLGKSRKSIIDKETKLTEEHILFLEKFKIHSVQIAPLSGKLNHKETIKQEKSKSNFAYEYESIVKYYKKIFMQIQNKVPLNNLYEIRKTFIPFFEKVQEQPFENLLFILQQRPKTDNLFYKSVAMSMMSIYIARQEGFEKKEWLQIGFAALLADAGFARMSKEVRNESDSKSPSETFQMHPFHSYKVIEEMTTLTKVAKISILQHQEHLDGSGYPAKITKKTMLPYARVIAISDFYFRIEQDNNLSKIIHLLEAKKGVQLDESFTSYLLQQLKAVEKKNY